MSGQLKFSLTALADGMPIQLNAVSSGGSRTLSVIFEPQPLPSFSPAPTAAPITPRTVWTKLQRLLSPFPLPALPDDVFLDKLLDAPLSVQATIASVAGKGLTVSLELTCTPAVDLPDANFKFVTIDGLLISYDQAAGATVRAKIAVPIVAKGVASAATKPEVVSFPPPVPDSTGAAAFKVNYVGVGQRVGPLPELGVTDPLATIFGKLEAALANPDPADILTNLAKGQFYQPDRDWFVALDVTVRDFDIQAIFNDPAMYGLRISVAASNKEYGGLLFEILYQKLGPGLGVYFGALTLPDNMRRIEIDGVLLVLPGISVWVYTNGDFRLNVGWPLGSVSISASVGDLLVGRAGFYFAKLRSSDVPGLGTYNPILQFGIALDIGAEVDFSAGPLSASLAVAVSGILQGVLAWAASNGNVVTKPDHYWFAGSVGLIVLVQGSVDFKIIQASIALRLEAQVSVAFETGYQTIIAVDAEVSVEVSVRVVFVTVHFSFDMTISHSFGIGSGDPALFDRPHDQGLIFNPVPVPAPPTTNTVSGTGASTVAGAPPVPPAASPPPPPPPPLNQSVARLKQTVFTDPVRANAFAAVLRTVGNKQKVAVGASFMLLPTALFNTLADAGQPALVAFLVLPSPDPSQAPKAVLTDFENLATGMLAWLLAQLPAASATTAATWLADAVACLGHGTSPPGGVASGAVFAGHDDFVTRVLAGLAATLTLTITAAVQPAGVEPVLPTGALLPMPDGMTLTVPLPTSPASTSVVALGQQPLSAMDATDFDAAGAPATPAPGDTLAKLLMADWLLLMLRQLTASLIAPTPTSDVTADLGTALSGCNFAQLAGFASRFLVSGLRIHDASSPPVLQPLYVCTQQQFEHATQATLAAAGAATAWVHGPATTSIALGTGALMAPAYQWLVSGPVGPMEATAAPMPAVREVPLCVALGRATPVNHAATPLVLAALPAQLLPGPRAKTTPFLNVTASDGTTETPLATQPAPVLLIPLTIARIPSPVAGTMWVPGIYAIKGTDDATRDLLDALWTAQLPCTIELLASTPGDQAFTLLAQAPGLVRTIPPSIAGSPAGTKLDTAGSADGGKNPAAFLRLLWEACVTQTSGNYLVDSTHLGGAEDEVFGSNPTATVDLLVSPVSSNSGTALPVWASHLAAAPVGGTLLAYPSIAPNVPVTTARPARTLGTVGFELDLGTPPQTNALVDVAGLYHVVQYAIGPGGEWQAPIGPTVASPAKDGTWSYQQVITPPAPAGKTGPYAAIGTPFDLSFRLLDIFGNLLPGTLPAIGSYTQTPLYSDALIAPSEWPNVQLTYSFAARPGEDAATLVMRCWFVADSALSQSTIATYSNRFATILMQLQDLASPAVAVSGPHIPASVTTSLDKNAACDTDVPLLPTLIRFVQSVQAALKNTQGGAVATIGSDPVGRRVGFAAVLAAKAQVLPLSANLTLARPTSLVDSKGANLLPSLGTVSTAAHPQIGTPGATASDLAAFATQFALAFAGMAGAKPYLAQRAGLPSGDAPAVAPALWVLLSGKGGVDLQPNPVPPISFALRPVCNQLVSGSLNGAMIRDVDLDAASGACLQAIDAALSPGRAVVLAGLTPTTPVAAAGVTTALDRLLAAKRVLAEVIPSGLDRVLTADRTSGDIDAARAAFRTALLTTLGSAMTVSTVVQARVDVGPNGAPVLSGDVGATLTPGASDSCGHFFLSSATLAPSTTAPTDYYLTSLLSVAEPTGQSALNVALSWSPAFLQDEIELDDSYSGFTPSSELAFVLPWPTLGFAATSLPLPLWLEPSRPRLLSHEAAEWSGAGSDQSAHADDSAALAADIEAVLQWQYSVQLSLTLDPQDEVLIDPGFNTGPVAAAADTGLPAGLASFFAAVMTFTANLPAHSSTLTSLDGTKPPDLAAVTLLVTDAEALASTWPASPVDVTTTEIVTPLTLKVSGSTAEMRLVPPPGAASPPADALWPVLSFGDPPIPATRTAAPGQSAAPWVSQYKLPPNADWTKTTLTWAPIAFRDQVSADFHCQVTRNPDLVARSPTNPAFVFSTPEMSFPSPLVPLLQSAGLPTIKPTLPLRDLLTVLLRTLAQVNGVANPVISITCSYLAQLLPVTTPGAGSAGLPLRMPVLMAMDLALPADDAAILKIATDLASEIADWRDRMRPTDRGASLEFTVTLFGASKVVTDAQELPLIQLRRLSISLAGAAPTFWRPAAPAAA